ncbi:hypothetical protein E2C01_044263 [Portunus trituberculatus]|uniref:Uncharacterized protein n=1 Tax=Portunus trituberculatus TaxID=210409 RepID=A0A5B7FYR3_PORTR|nr:hypothetical protein [Portunus trituberculatus]
MPVVVSVVAAAQLRSATEDLQGVLAWRTRVDYHTPGLTKLTRASNSRHSTIILIQTPDSTHTLSQSASYLPLLTLATPFSLGHTGGGRKRRARGNSRRPSSGGGELRRGVEVMVVVVAVAVWWSGSMAGWSLWRCVRAVMVVLVRQETWVSQEGEGSRGTQQHRDKDWTFPW